jgi:hypothetical protein
VRGGGSPRDAADDGDAEAEGEDDEDDESDEDDDELWDPMHGRLPDAPRRQSRGAAGGDGGSDEDALGEEASSSDPHLLRRLVREARAEDEGDEQQQPDEEDEPRMISAPRPAPPLDHIESAARGGGRFCVRTTRARRPRLSDSRGAHECYSATSKKELDGDCRPTAPRFDKSADLMRTL